MRNLSIHILVLALGVARTCAALEPSDGPGARLWTPPRILQERLQEFIDAAYLRAFREVGEEKDFDHGHILYDSLGHPFAVLYHTQELSALRSPSRADFLDPEARNWIQWLDTGRLEDARRYLRKTYPSGASWDWFRLKELPALRAHRTVLDKMLDPALLGTKIAVSRQWTFTRNSCSSAADSDPASLIHVLLPDKRTICLTSSAF